jgi:hypothetical protein
MSIEPAGTGTKSMASVVPDIVCANGASVVGRAAEFGLVAVDREASLADVSPELVATDVEDVAGGTFVAGELLVDAADEAESAGGCWD